jgi:hypothetical protein
MTTEFLTMPLATDLINALAAETREFDAAIKSAAQRTRRFQQAILAARESAAIRLYKPHFPTIHVKGLP